MSWIRVDADSSLAWSYFLNLEEHRLNLCSFLWPLIFQISPDYSRNRQSAAVISVNTGIQVRRPAPEWILGYAGMTDLSAIACIMQVSPQAKTQFSPRKTKYLPQPVLIRQVGFQTATTTFNAKAIQQ